MVSLSLSQYFTKCYTVLKTLVDLLNKLEEEIKTDVKNYQDAGNLGPHTISPNTIEAATIFFRQLIDNPSCASIRDLHEELVTELASITNGIQRVHRYGYYKYLPLCCKSVETSLTKIELDTKCYNSDGNQTNIGQTIYLYLSDLTRTDETFDIQYGIGPGVDQMSNGPNPSGRDYKVVDSDTLYTAISRLRAYYISILKFIGKNCPHLCGPKSGSCHLSGCNHVELKIKVELLEQEIESLKTRVEQLENP